MKSSYFPWLDAVRFIAAFLVLLGHTRNELFLTYDALPACQQGIFSSMFYFLTRLGHEAVIVFFVLSGFLVGGRGVERITARTFDNKSYIIDRAVRIGIPLVTAILFCFVVYLILDIRFDIWIALGNLFSLQGVLCESLVGPFWSLSYEVWFYIMLLGLSLLMARRKSGMVILLVCALVFLKLNPTYLFIWIIGACSYLCIPARPNRVIRIGSFLLSVLFVALGVLASESHAIETKISLNQGVSELLLAVSLGVFFQQIVLCPPSSRFGIRIERAFSYLAKFSYTLYLTHPLTLLLVFSFLFSRNQACLDFAGIISFIAVILICTMVSWGLYLVSERYTAAVKKKIKSMINSKNQS